MLNNFADTCIEKLKWNQTSIWNKSSKTDRLLNKQTERKSKNKP